MGLSFHTKSCGRRLEKANQARKSEQNWIWKAISKKNCEKGQELSQLQLNVIFIAHENKIMINPKGLLVF